MSYSEECMEVPGSFWKMLYSIINRPHSLFAALPSSWKVEM